MSLNLLPDDLILEILCKIKCRSLIIVLSNKRLLKLYNYNKKWVSKNIINSYNLILIDDYKMFIILLAKTDGCIYKMFELAVTSKYTNYIKILLKNNLNIIYDYRSVYFLIDDQFHILHRFGPYANKIITDYINSYNISEYINKLVL